MYADVIAFRSETADPQKGLDILYVYCKEWKVTVNANRTKFV